MFWKFHDLYLRAIKIIKNLNISDPWSSKVDGDSVVLEWRSRESKYETEQWSVIVEIIDEENCFIDFFDYKESSTPTMFEFNLKDI